MPHDVGNEIKSKGVSSLLRVGDFPGYLVRSSELEFVLPVPCGRKHRAWETIHEAKGVCPDPLATKIIEFSCFHVFMKWSKYCAAPHAVCQPMSSPEKIRLHQFFRRPCTISSCFGNEKEPKYVKMKLKNEKLQALIFSAWTTHYNCVEVSHSLSTA